MNSYLNWHINNVYILEYFLKTNIGTKKFKIYSKLGSWKMEENPKNLRIFLKEWKKSKICLKLELWKMEGNPNSNILGYFQKTQILFKIGIMKNGRKSKEF